MGEVLKCRIQHVFGICSRNAGLRLCQASVLQNPTGLHDNTLFMFISPAVPSWMLGTKCSQIEEILNSHLVSAKSTELKTFVMISNQKIVTNFWNRYSLYQDEKNKWPRSQWKLYGSSEKVAIKGYVSWADGIIIVLWPKLYFICLRDFFHPCFS